MRALLASSLILFSFACSDSTPAVTGSSAIAVSPDDRWIYAVDSDNGAIAILGRDGGVARSFEVGAVPVRIARSGSRLFVSLRGERALAVLSILAGGELRLDQKIALGAEPFGVVTNEDGSRIYVASSLSNEVAELDGATLAILRKWTVEGEPRWLAIHPSGAALYVAPAHEGKLATIDLAADRVISERLPIPRTRFALSARVTGDPSVSPDGSMIAVPVMYFNHRETIVEATGLMEMPVVEQAYLRSDEEGFGRFRSELVIAKIDVAPDLERPVLVHVGDLRSTPGYIASSIFTSDGSVVLTAIEGARRVIAVGLAPGHTRLGSVVGSIFQDDNHPTPRGVPNARPAQIMRSVLGPNAFALSSDGEVFVYTQIGRELGSFSRSELTLAPEASGVVKRLAGLAPSKLPADVLVGRMLFYSADNAAMSGPGSGVSCATCHFDGRTNGLTWYFDRGPRQTPSLAGEVSKTSPVRWEGDRATVADDALQTSRAMGGQGLTHDMAMQIQAFVDSTPEVDTPLRGSFDPSVLRGKALFERADVGCSKCHYGERFTDNQMHPMFELEAVKTRSLVGLAGSPPYFHDGSAPTIRAVLDRARTGAMGDTSMLDESEMADLEKYLLAL